MFGERGFSEQEYIHEREEAEEQAARDPTHIAQAEAHSEAREQRKEVRHQHRRRWLRAIGRLLGRGDRRAS
jgi:hypothetical protein